MFCLNDDDDDVCCTSFETHSEEKHIPTNDYTLITFKIYENLKKKKFRWRKRIDTRDCWGEKKKRNSVLNGFNYDDELRIFTLT